jgi:KaiC/GvpD/RAD55 family RecA-like ATPase
MSYTVIDAANWANLPYQPPEFIIEHLVPKQSLCVWTGDTGTAKSSFALSAAVAHAHHAELASWFDVHSCPRPVMICQAEMTSADLRRYFKEVEAAYNLGGVPANSVLFQGTDGVADFSFGAENDQRNDDFEALLSKHNPCFVIIDTLRQHIEIDENDAVSVRKAFGWLARIAKKYDVSIIVLHHWRKSSATGANNASQRVSGSRDIVSKADLHLAFIGRPVTELILDKTRTPLNGVRTNTSWLVCSTRDEQSNPPRSEFMVTQELVEGSSAAKSESGIDQCKATITAELEAGPMTREQLGVSSGNMKRAFEALKNDGTIVEAKAAAGRKSLYRLANSEDAASSATSAQLIAEETTDLFPANDDLQAMLAWVDGG